MLWDISYANLNMLLATIPKYDAKAGKEPDEIEHDSFEGIENYI